LRRPRRGRRGAPSSRQDLLRLELRHARGSLRRTVDGPRSDQSVTSRPLAPHQKEETAMRYMMMVKADANYEAGMPPDPALMEKMGAYTEEMMKAGVVLMTGGLGPSATGARIDVGGRRVRVTDGPFAETKELIGGFAII